MTTRLPKTFTVTGGEITLRPMTAEDQTAVLDFFRRVPAEDRVYFKEDVTSPEVIDRWARSLDYSRVLPVLAWDQDRVVGDGTLHRSRASARRHVGEVRIVIEPDYRHRGIGRGLLQTLVDVALAEDTGLEKVVFEVADTEHSARHTAEALGFARVATFTQHIRYIEGQPHDLHVYELRVGQRRELDDPAAHMF